MYRIKLFYYNTEEGSLVRINFSAKIGWLSNSAVNLTQKSIRLAIIYFWLHDDWTLTPRLIEYWYLPEAWEPLFWLEFEVILWEKLKCQGINCWEIIEIKDILKFFLNYIKTIKILITSFPLWKSEVNSNCFPQETIRFQYWMLVK